MNFKNILFYLTGYELGTPQQAQEISRFAVFTREGLA